VLLAPPPAAGRRDAGASAAEEEKRKGEERRGCWRSGDAGIYSRWEWRGGNQKWERREVARRRTAESVSGTGQKGGEWEWE
jgi:hypothetical protein